MWTDPIVEEIHAVRHEVTAEYGGNSRAVADYFLKKQAEMAVATNAAHVAVKKILCRLLRTEYAPNVSNLGYSRNIQWDIASRIIGQTDGAAVNPSSALSQTYGYDNARKVRS
jgi:hypothetical protein